VQAVLLDALGTLLELERPWPALVHELAEHGVDVTEAQARDALLTEMAFYRANHSEASDRAGLARLRSRCTDVLRAGLSPAADGLDAAQLEQALIASLRFRPFAEVPEVLGRLRDAGARLVVVSNWDVSLHDVLEETGLAPSFEAVVTSAEFGAAKPHPAIFAHALRLAGSEAQDALHAGDSIEEDVAGALAAGVRPVLVSRDGTTPEPLPDGVAVIETLAGLNELIH
jgi:putative hydrolase of the HAD superfamily